MKLYLIRHATPVIPNYKDFPGPSLGEKGKQEAQKITKFLKEKTIHNILISDYTRVLETLKPYQDYTNCTAKVITELRERENEIETHEELVDRVQNWFEKFLRKEPLHNTAIFSHCGPINMILEYLDKEKTILNYPYVCKHLCLTPKGGVWLLNVVDKKLQGGELYFL